MNDKSIRCAIDFFGIYHLMLVAEAYKPVLYRYLARHNFNLTIIIISGSVT